MSIMKIVLTLLMLLMFISMPLSDVKGIKENSEKDETIVLARLKVVEDRNQTRIICMQFYVQAAGYWCALLGYILSGLLPIPVNSFATLGSVVIGAYIGILLGSFRAHLVC